MRFYHVATGQPIDGQVITHRSNGNVRTIRNHLDGLPHGNDLFFYRNGQLACGTIYTKGILHGERLEFSKRNPFCPETHFFYYNGGNITSRIRKEMGYKKDYVLTNEDRMLISLRYGIPMLPWKIPLNAK